MAINKVEYAGAVLIDLTQDTVTENTLLKGYTAHKADGTIVEGIVDPNVASDEVFGYDIALATEDSNERCSYPSDVTNAAYDYAGIDQDSGEFNYGGWKNAFFMPRPCMLNTDGTVAYYLDENDYSKKKNGDDSDVADLSFDGNAMIEWPKIYTKRWEEDNVYHFRCAATKIDDDYECWCNYTKDNSAVKYFYTPIYNGLIDDNGKLRSISGVTYSWGKTLPEAVTAASENGEDYTIQTYADMQLIKDLLFMIGKTTNAQGRFGYGHCGSKSGAGNQHATGTMDQKGMFWGSLSDKKVGVKVFGMENFWGEASQDIVGAVVDNGEMKIKATRGVYDGTTVSDYNLTGEGYLSAGKIPYATAVTSGGWLKGTSTVASGRIPYSNGGADGKYESDYTWINATIVANVTIGGYSSVGNYAGPNHFAANITTESGSWYRNQRLSYRG